MSHHRAGKRGPKGATRQGTSGRRRPVDRSPIRERPTEPAGPRSPRRGRTPLLVAGIAGLLVLAAGIVLVLVLARDQLLGGGTHNVARGIVYADGERIWLLDPAAPAGGNRGRRELLNVSRKGSVADPAWSPDGMQIAYSFTPVPAAGATYGSDIYVMDADGARSRAVFTHDSDGGLARAPVWSPDGGSLYFSYSFSRPAAGGTAPSVVQQIERLDLKSGARTVVAPGGDLPALAPDGTRLAYLRLGQGAEGATSLWVARADGSDERRLIGENQFTALWAPRFAPDGRTILVAASGGETATPRLNVRQPRTSGQDWPPAAAAHGYPMDLWLVDATSGRLELLAALGADDLAAAWSPDGGRLALSSGLGLFVLDLTTADLSPRSTTPGFGSLDWSR